MTSVRELTKVYGTVRAVDELTFDVEPGTDSHDTPRNSRRPALYQQHR